MWVRLPLGIFMIMKSHTWITVEIDGGPLGTEDFWQCSECGASGGPVDWGSPKTNDWIFLAGPAIDLPKDCDQSKEIIEKYRLSGKWPPIHATPQSAL